MRYGQMLNVRHAKRCSFFVTLILASILFSFFPLRSVNASEKLRIVNYERHLNRKYKKIVRKKTLFIIVHTSEAGLKSTLRTVTKGKKINGRKRYSKGGHANYVIARNGTIYRTLNKRYRADHAGLSLWNGLTDISSYSLGIELVAYHNSTITDEQYKALRKLLPVLRKIYSIRERDVLAHCQVAYGYPNRWFPQNHRGRKRCAMNFEAQKAGLSERWRYDPDVQARHIQADVQLATVIYGKKRHHYKANKITRYLTAWNIAGGDYDSSSTYYKLPDGRQISGNNIAKQVGWNKIPVGTKVVLNQSNPFKKGSPIITITENSTAWVLVGKKFNKSTTFYNFPNGTLQSGKDIHDWDDIPIGTKMIVDYLGPYKITKKRTPYSLVGFGYKKKEIIYYIPGKKLKTGELIRNFNRLPSGTCILIPTDSELNKMSCQKTIPPPESGQANRLI